VDAPEWGLDRHTLGEPRRLGKLRTSRVDADGKSKVDTKRQKRGKRRRERRGMTCAKERVAKDLFALCEL
jgi:hypothetical protein